MDTVREPLLVLDADLGVRSANQSFYQTFQVTAEETEVGRPTSSATGSWTSRSCARCSARSCPTAVTDFEVEHEFASSAGAPCCSTRARLDPAHLILLAIEDITERKRAEAAVRRSEERLRRVLETDSVGVLFFDAAGKVVEANEVFLRMTGYTRSEVRARELTWRRMTPPEWVAASEEQMRTSRRPVASGPTRRSTSSRMAHGPGCCSPARHRDGTYVEFCVDISDRKRAEAERELLARELSHRVKNICAVVQSLATQTNGHIKSVDAYREAFLGRLHALASVHGLLLDTNWQRSRPQGPG